MKRLFLSLVLFALVACSPTNMLKVNIKENPGSDKSTVTCFVLEKDEYTYRKDTLVVDEIISEKVDSIIKVRVDQLIQYIYRKDSTANIVKIVVDDYRWDNK